MTASSAVQRHLDHRPPPAASSSFTTSNGLRHYYLMSVLALVVLCSVTTFLANQTAVANFMPLLKRRSDAHLLVLAEKKNQSALAQSSTIETFLDEFRRAKKTMTSSTTTTNNHTTATSNHRVIIAADSLWYQSGGPEALVQLALAFHDFLPALTYLGLLKKEGNKARLRIGPRFLQEYPLIRNLTTLRKRDLTEGDVLIVPEIVSCDKSLVQTKGVKMYIWLLRSRNKAWHRSNEEEGCGIVAHNYYLRDNLGSNSPHLLRPYVSPSLVQGAPRSFAPRSEKIVWFNPEVDNEIVDQAQTICRRQLNCTAKKVGGFQRHELPAAYQQGTVVFETCMKGSERVVLEATVHGNIFVTTDCDCAKDSRDFPIPRRNILPSNDGNLTIHLANALERIFQNYESEWNDYEDMRKLYREDLGHDSLVKEAKSFLYEIHKNDYRLDTEG